MKKYILLLAFFLSLLPKPIRATEANRFVTIVNPVRGSSLWQSTDSVLKQIDLIKNYKLPATWLLQYDLLDDDKLSLFKNLASNQEIGVFLEVSEKLATDAYVPYLLGEGDWARADKILLSGYTPEARKKMLDKVFAEFKKRFGYYPSSVGAWYIDTLSQNFLVDKYHIQTILNVADQYQTDTYGLWGQPWGTPYYPSRLNSLTPAEDDFAKLAAVKIQWAHRDPVRGYGLNVENSIYSVQANDYINNHLNFDYFKKLSQLYLDTPNDLSQLTIGLEAGQEGAIFLDEFRRQLQFLVDPKMRISFETMQSFAEKFKKQFPNASSNFLIAGTDYLNPEILGYWYSTRFYRIGLIQKSGNLYLRDLRLYKDPILFEDIFEKDSQHVLKRIISSVVEGTGSDNGRLLMSNVDQIKMDRKNEDLYLTVFDKKNNEHEIILKEGAVVLDKKNIFEVQDTNKQRNNMANLIIDYWKNLPSNWFPRWRFSTIDKKFYFGFMIAPDKLFGFKSEFPFFGVSKFPFQTLVRFKTFPHLDLARLLSSNLVNWLNHSTIKKTRLTI